MKWIGVLSLCFFSLAVTLVDIADAQQADWYPSEWGPDDQRGAANRLTPAKVLSAAELITMENLATEVLADSQTYEFLFVYAPLPLKGAPGSPVNPVAIR